MTEPQLPTIGDVRPTFTATPVAEIRPHPSKITEEAIDRARNLTAYITEQMVWAALRGDLKLARAYAQMR